MRENLPERHGRNGRTGGRAKILLAAFHAITRSSDRIAGRRRLAQQIEASTATALKFGEVKSEPREGGYDSAAIQAHAAMLLAGLTETNQIMHLTRGGDWQLHLDGTFSLWKVFCCIETGNTFHLGLELVQLVARAS